MFKRYFLVETGTEHSESQLRQMNSEGELCQVPFTREIKAICDKVHRQDPIHLAIRLLCTS
jgi:hypothetical protein